MATISGYMEKLQGYVYEGEYLLGEAVHNGEFVNIVEANSGDYNGDIVIMKLTAAHDARLRVREKTTIFGTTPALRLEVLSVGTTPVYFVENVFTDVNNESEDTTEWVLEPVVHGLRQYGRIHQILPGESMIIGVDQTTYDLFTVGQSAMPTTGGTVAVAT